MDRTERARLRALRNNAAAVCLHRSLRRAAEALTFTAWPLPARDVARIIDALDAAERERDALRAQVAAAREDEREACAALAEKVFDEHPLTLDRRHEPGCICHAIARGSCSECDRGAAILAALRGQGGAP